MEIDRRDALRLMAGGAIGTAWERVEGLARGSCAGAVDVPGFVSYRFTDRAGVCRPLYVIGDGPPVLLLHELPGLVCEDLEAARRVSELGYRVVAPLFFGTPGGRTTTAGVIRAARRVCGVRQFACNKGELTSPHVIWLRELCAAIRDEWPAGKGLGVIGMCLTGAFPLALLPVPAVTAAVVCQPTVPFNAFTRLGWFTDESALGLHPDDLAAARTQSRAPILGLRYTGDRLSRPQRFRRLTKEFGDRFYRLDIVGKGHSTLASSFCPQAFLEVSALFNSYVKAAPDTSVPAFPVRARRASEDEVDLCICQTATHHE